MMATPAPPILVERMQSVQKKEEILFANANLDFQGWLSTYARDPPNQQETQDQLFLKVPATRSVCSQLMQKAQKDTTVTALETGAAWGIRSRRQLRWKNLLQATSLTQIFGKFNTTSSFGL